MGNGSKVPSVTFKDMFADIIKDSSDILFKITQAGYNKDEPVEIQSELPASADPDIILGYVKRWLELQKALDCDLRIYAWSYTPEVEKYVLRMTNHMSHIHVTTLPTYLKER
jgi:hypothetical protein